MTDEVKPVRLRPEIAALPVYRQGRPAPDGGFKLSSNENPFPPLAGVIDAVHREAHNMNRYPDATAAALSSALAARFDVDAGRVHVGSGSVALLAQLIAAAAGHGDEVIYSWRSFEAYPGLVTTAGATSVQVPNRTDGGHDFAAMLAAIGDRTRVVIVCSPNNPTGVAAAAGELTDFLDAVPTDLLVLLDEAYLEFRTDEVPDAIPLLHRYPNLVVLRTFSKAYGLAALRVGYAVGSEQVLDAARATAIPLSVTDAAQVAALASLQHEQQLMERVGEVAARRDSLVTALRAQGWSVPESQSNFIWLASGERTAELADAFYDAGLTVRAFPPEGIRVSIGEAESLEAILAVANGFATIREGVR